MTDPACSLDAAGLEVQLGAWAALGPSCRRLERGEEAAVAWFDADAGDRLAKVVAAERSCCSFLALDLAPDGDRLRLDLAPGRPVGETVVGRLVAELVRGGAPAQTG